MIAQVGDRLVVQGVHVGDARRVGEIIAVRHADGTPPYEVRWLDSGQEALVFSRLLRGQSARLRLVQARAHRFADKLL